MKIEFANGSYEIAKAIMKNKNKTIYSVVGGGDTISLINKIMQLKINFVSTAGGTFCDMKEELPGIKLYIKYVRIKLYCTKNFTKGRGILAADESTGTMIKD